LKLGKFLISIVIFDEGVLEQWIDARLKEPKPNHFDDLQAIPVFHPQNTEAIADDRPKTALKSHFVVYIHVDGQLFEFGKSFKLLKLLFNHCGPTTPSTLIKDASIKVNEITEEVKNKHVVAMALTAGE
jgi:hypothetical protein